MIPLPTTPDSALPRRAVLAKLAYATPVILTLAALPAFASKGSGASKRNNYKDKRAEPGRGFGA